MRKSKSEGEASWLREEPLGWVLVTLLLGCDCGFLFGFNGVRAALDGHPWGGVVVMGVEAAVGCWCAWSSLCELWWRWKRRGNGVE